MPDPARSVTIQALKTNQGTKFETLEKPIFSLFDEIIFLKKKNKTKQKHISLVHDFQKAILEIITPFLGEKGNNRPWILLGEIR